MTEAELQAALRSFAGVANRVAESENLLLPIATFVINKLQAGDNVTAIDFARELMRHSVLRGAVAQEVAGSGGS